jgi:hypothetical protein
MESVLGFFDEDDFRGVAVGQRQEPGQENGTIGDQARGNLDQRFCGTSEGIFE